MPGRRVLKQFENLHPRLLQWDVDYKIASLRSTKFKGFWAIERKEWIGEIILSWENCDNIVHVDSIGVIESATGKGIGTSLTLRALEWAKEKGLFAEVFDTIESMDKAIDKLAATLATSSPDAMKEIKKIFWKGTEHWSELLKERAAISGRLILTSHAKNAIASFKNK